MNKYFVTIWRENIDVRQLNVYNPQTGQLDVRVYDSEGRWTLKSSGSVLLPRPV
jgi:hypothetical protein